MGHVKSTNINLICHFTLFNELFRLCLIIVKSSHLCSGTIIVSSSCVLFNLNTKNVLKFTALWWVMVQEWWMSQPTVSADYGNGLQIKVIEWRRQIYPVINYCFMNYKTSWYSWISFDKYELWSKYGAVLLLSYKYSKYQKNYVI